MWGVGGEEDISGSISKNQQNNQNKNDNNKNPIDQTPLPLDPASVYRNDENFLSLLRSADLTVYSFGAPRTGSPQFSKVRKYRVM